MYQIEVRHQGLNKYRLIKGLDPYAVKQKAEAQQATWDEQWAKVEARERARDLVESKAERAQMATRAAHDEVQALRDLLAKGIRRNPAIDWETLKDTKPFPVAPPVAPSPPKTDRTSNVPPKPAASDQKYGTVMNEGAGKGILVTTADYGPDAYEFIKGKPLVLLNGAQLLYLLQRHGYKGRIDLAEAKRIDQAARMSTT